MNRIALILHDIRSTHNVGSMLRSADGFGVERIICTGYTPYPRIKNDTRLPHEIENVQRQLHKTALGAEDRQDIDHAEDIKYIVSILKNEGWSIVGLEQSIDSVALNSFHASNDVALIVGNEVTGLPKEILSLCDAIVEIPMQGKKESFNVSVATGITLYALRNPIRHDYRTGQ